MSHLAPRRIHALANVAGAIDKLPFCDGPDTMAVTDFTAFGRSLVDDAAAVNARATLGLVIGTDVQAQDAELQAIAGLASAADQAPYFTGSGTAALASLTAFGRSLIDDAAAVNARATLGLVIGTDVQAFDPQLADVAGLTPADNNFIVGNGTNFVTESGNVARTSLGVGSGDSPTFTGLTLSAALAMGGAKITGLGAPTADSDASTKLYVDGVAQGLRVKDSVELATAAALPAHTRSGNVLTMSATGTVTIDGVVSSAGQRVLVKDEGGGSHLENGIYDVTTAGAVGVAGVFTRSSDADVASELEEGSFVWVKSGTANQNTRWAVSSEPATINVEPIAFTQISGAAELTAGAGLTKTGNTIDVVGAGADDGIIVNADSIQVDWGLVGSIANVTKAAAAAGTSGTAARADHKHDISTAAASAIGIAAAAAEGTSTSLARADHEHGQVPNAAGVDWGSPSLPWDLHSRERIVATAAKTAAYTAAAGDYLLLCDPATASFTVTLMSASGITGRVLVIKHSSNSANTVTVDGAGAETIDGAPTQVLNSRSSISIVSDGTNWVIL